MAEISPTTLSNTSICTRSSYNARDQLTQQGIDGMAPTVYDDDSMGHVCRQTLLLDADAPDDASKNRIITHSNCLNII
ncbi:MAG: hypothetical protein ACI4P8_00225 [Akkermansia sp.]